MYEGALKGAVLDMTNKDDYSFYLKGSTYGLITCTTEFHIEICENLAAVAETFDFLYMQGDYNGSTTIDIAAFFSTIETPECFFQGFKIQEYNSLSG